MVSTGYLIGFDIGVIVLVVLLIRLRIYCDRLEQQAKDRRLDEEVRMIKGDGA